ncbi:MAG: outer membrane beta-barrel protein [Hyphomicrobiales bacterium]
MAGSLVSSICSAAIVLLSWTLTASAQEENTFDQLDLELRDSLAQQDEVSRITGLRLGSFQANPVLEVGVSHQDSETTKTLRGELSIESQWSRHSLRLDTEVDTASRRGLSVSDWSIGATLSGRRDISERVNAAGELRLSHEGSEDEQDQTLYGLTGTLTVAPGPTEISLRGSFDGQRVGDAVAGADTNNNFRQYGTGVRAAYRRSAVLSPFIQADYTKQNTGTVSNFNGDASRWELRTGLIIDRGEKLSGEVAIGAGRISTSDASRDELSSLLWSASLVWSPVRLTTVTLDTAGTLEFNDTTDLAGTTMTSGVRSNSFALRAERSFNYRLDGFANTGLTHEDYGDIDRTDHTFVVSAGLAYKLTPDSSLLGEVTHERTSSSGVDQDEEDERSNGISLRFQLRK